MESINKLILPLSLKYKIAIFYHSKNWIYMSGPSVLLLLLASKIINIIIVILIFYIRLNKQIVFSFSLVCLSMCVYTLGLQTLYRYCVATTSETNKSDLRDTHRREEQERERMLDQTRI